MRQDSTTRKKQLQLKEGRKVGGKEGPKESGKERRKENARSTKVNLIESSDNIIATIIHQYIKLSQLKVESVAP